MPVPGIGAGVLEPGQDFGAYLDRMMLDGRMWVQSRTWDPEGMLVDFIFAFSALVAKMFGFIKLAQPDGGTLSLGLSLYAPIRALPIAPVNTSLLYALLFNAGMFAIAWFMWRKKWFVKV